MTMTETPMAPPPEQQHKPSSKGKGSKPSATTQKVRSYTPWDQAEEDALKRGVADHGLGAWQTILSDPRYSVLEARSGIQLKDKWRNMIKMRHAVNPPKLATSGKNNALIQRAPNGRPPRSDPLNKAAPLAIDVPESHPDASYGPQSNRSDHTNHHHPSDGTEPSSMSFDAHRHLRSPRSAASDVAEDTSVNDRLCMGTTGRPQQHQQTLWRPTPLPSTCGLAAVALHSINTLAGAVMSQQREQAEQRQHLEAAQQHRKRQQMDGEAGSRGEGLSGLAEEVVTAMEVALEAHEIQLEANKQLELVLGAVERRVPGMQSWMRNAVHVAQLANEKANEAWHQLKVAQRRAKGISAVDASDDGSRLSEGQAPELRRYEHEEEEEDCGEEEEHQTKGFKGFKASPLPDDVSDEDEAAAEALSTLQSGILLQQPAPPSLPNDATLAVQEKEGLPVIIGDDGAFTMFDRPLGCDELQRWASVVQLAARKKRRKRRTPSQDLGSDKHGFRPSPPPAKSGRRHY